MTPILDPVATGRNIDDIRRDRNLSVAALKDALGLLSLIHI